MLMKYKTNLRILYCRYIADLLTSAKMLISHDIYTISEDDLVEKFLTWDLNFF